MYKLRDYQRRAVENAVAFFEDGTARDNAIIVLPTGAGKSLVIAAIAMRLDAPLLIFCPSKEILEQNYNKLLTCMILGDVGIWSASAGRKDVGKVTFCTIGSAVNHPEVFEMFRYVIVDECHAVNAKGGMYEEFLTTIRCRVLGLTATPFRLHSNRMGSSLRMLHRTRPRLFSRVLCYEQVGTLQEQGYLSPMNYYPIKTIDITRLKVNSTGADYTDISVRAEYRLTGFAGKLLNVVERLLNAGRRGVLVFTRFIEEAALLVEMLGYDAAIVTGATPKAERERVLREFRSGRVRVVANVGVLTTGFDYPELDTVVLARPTRSLGLYYQMCGRAIRPYEGKVSWVVDLCDNVERFGRIQDLRLRADQKGRLDMYSGERKLTSVLI